ncbi:MMPL family transporter [Kutzneria buriramensis]|uniref:RND superfamily putative drug exporter n=1 Tax=Kutzneria buriramensis TaxID=1045776 RepID=A0A3E0HQF1_9PSEU|nr:MMPL family transporter [Kutzneria buriramensis]REH48490.1 RND superfamily putative drug exporter [Kutzneria buriramensis]
MPERHLTVRLARWSATHPWRAIVGWVLFVVLCAATGSLVTSNQIHGEDGWVGEYGRGQHVAADAGLLPPQVEKVLITAASGHDAPATGPAAAREITDRMRALPAVASVADPIRSADGSALVVPVTMKGDDKVAGAKLPTLLDQTAAVQAAHPELRVSETGTVSTGQAPGQQLGHDLVRAEMITLPVTLVILFFVFGSLLVAGVPVLLALSSVMATTGLYALASYVFPDPGGAVSNVVLMMGMAVGVDYSLFYVKRVREERERNGTISPAAAIELAARTSGRAILVSGVAVLLSLVGLYLADDVIFAAIASGSIIVVAIAMVSSLTVLPALLAKMGPRVDRRRLRRRGAKPTESRLWAAMLRPAMRHPAATLAASVIVIFLLALPALGIKLATPTNANFPPSIPSIATYDEMTRLFPDQGAAHLVVVRDDPARSDQVAAALSDLAGRTRGNSLFATGPDPVVQASADGGVHTLRLPVPYGSNTDQAQDSLRQLRSQLVPATVGTVPGADVAVAGDVALSVDYVDHQTQHTPLVLGFVLLLTFLVMLFAFRSVVIGLVGVVLNLLSAIAAFGVVTAVFQNTWAQPLLGFTSDGFVSSRLPLILFVILFGLSMDYQIFVVSRIREAALRGVPPRRAVFDGITGSAGVVTSAAVVMVSVFVSFVFVGLTELKEIGFGLAVAVLLDAVIVRIMILPSLLALLGKAAWWPSRAVREAQSTADSHATVLESPHSPRQPVQR